jgi:hypothetical protein
MHDAAIMSQSLFVAILGERVFPGRREANKRA